MLGFYRKQGEIVKSSKIRHEKASQRPDWPLRGLNFDTICICPELLQIGHNHPRFPPNETEFLIRTVWFR